MRTRIALVAIIPVAVITVSTLTEAATQEPALAVPNATQQTAIAMPPDRLIAYQGLTHPTTKTGTGPDLVFNLGAALQANLAAAKTATTATPASSTASPSPVASVTPATAAPAAAVTAAAPASASVQPTDTVTPAERAAWERVAMCEEGGAWSAGNGEFSGGLGITRSNWDAYGGLAYAADGAGASEDEQIMVAERIQANPPDQYGCRGW